MNLFAPSHIANYIGGNLQAAINGNYMGNTNPATGEVYSQRQTVTLPMWMQP